MATGKRFYWIKLKKDFLTSDAIEFLMSNDRGSDYVVLYLQLCPAMINTSGRLESRIGEMIVPFDVDRIQREGRYFPRETVEKALDIYKRIGLIYEDCDGTLIISDYGDMVGSETDYARQKRNQRNVDNTVDSAVDNVHTEIRDKSSEIRDKSSEERVRGENGFTPPTLEELKAFAVENGYTEAELPVERFIDYYQSKRRMIGGSPMADWKAKAREWVGRYREEHPSRTASDYDVPEDDLIFW